MRYASRQRAAAELIKAIRRIPRRAGRTGYRSVAEYLKRAGLKVPSKARKRRRVGGP